MKFKQIVLADLRDHGDGGGTLGVTIEADENGIEIRPRGYGDKVTADGHGCPIYLELAGGEPVLYVWADVNREDPTHTISLAGAKESLRAEG